MLLNASSSSFKAGNVWNASMGGGERENLWLVKDLKDINSGHLLGSRVG